MGNIQDLQKIWCRLAMGHVPKKLDLVYMHGLSEGMVKSCDLFSLCRASVVEDEAISTRIAFNGSDGRGASHDSQPGSAWPGGNWYVEGLFKVGIPTAQMFPTRPGLHTRDECDALIALMKEKKWLTVGIVTVPYHWPRVISCIVGSMVAADWKVKVYFVRPTLVNWGQEMIGSQGTNKTSFQEEAGEEVHRIFSYWDTGGVGGAWVKSYGAPPEHIFEYFDWRDM